MDGLEQDKENIIGFVKDCFPKPTIESRIEIQTFNNAFNICDRKYFIVVKFSDFSISAEDFDDYLRDLYRFLKLP